MDWLRDYDMAMVRESNGNFIRWMHVAAQPVDIRAADKYGVACIQPAGDKEGEPAAGNYHNRQWDQRVEAMRDTIIYFRNSPSILFWEAGNSFIRAAYMKEMTDLRKEIDPHGMRAMGCRALADEQDAVDESEYVGTMLGRKVEDDNGYTANGELTRDKRAILESEYHREESPRRIWDDYSPPEYDYVHGSVYGLTDSEGDSWDMTAEDFLRTAVKEYKRYFKNRVSSNSSRPIYSAAAALCWTDSTQHGRNHLTENARMSGRVDPARVKKQSFYAYQVPQSTKPAVYVMGHWNYSENKSDYPKGLDPTDKTVYVIASNCKYVELLINGESVAKNGSPENGFLYAFKNIDVTQHGKIEAVARNTKGEELAWHTIETAGEAAEIRLTPYTGPEGLLADGSDIAYFDVEIVDANGIVLPLDYRQLNLSLTGDATLRGGYNSGYYVNYGTDFMSAGDAHFKTVNGKNAIHVGELNYKWDGTPKNGTSGSKVEYKLFGVDFLSYAKKSSDFLNVEFDIQFGEKGGFQLRDGHKTETADLSRGNPGVTVTLDGSSHPQVEHSKGQYTDDSITIDTAAWYHVKLRGYSNGASSYNMWMQKYDNGSLVEPEQKFSIEDSASRSASTRPHRLVFNENTKVDNISVT